MIGIRDTNLREHDGQVQVGVAITSQRPIQMPRGWVPPLRFPSRECYGVPDETIWTVGRMRVVTFEFNVEHWQSGWRVSQNQPWH
ncbi:MAG TPA: hypothetical protein VGW40_10555 [Allosphingosinicella sp.]|nr:hypothetical protein [Allosphingosinicella sp.]